MSAESLTIRMTGDAGTIPAESLASALSRMVGLLRAIEGQMPRRCRIDKGWQIVDVSHGSPFAVEIKGMSSQSEEASAAVIGACLDGLVLLDNGANGLPSYYDRNALEAARDFVSVLGDGVSDLALLAPGRPTLRPSQRIAATASQLLPREHEELGTIQGQVETLRMHTGHLFTIWDVVTGAAVQCTTDPDGLAVAHRAWGQRVRVFGRITYSVDNEPQSMIVEQIRILPPEAEIRSAEDFKPVKVRDGKTTDEHVEVWWHGKRPNSVGQ